MPPPECPSREKLSHYVLGLLPDSEAVRIVEHVSTCPTCEVALDTLESISDPLVQSLRLPSDLEAYQGEAAYSDALARAEEAGGSRSIPMSQAGEQGAPVGSSPRESSAPTVLGEYRILEELGRGGMGTVYRAVHTRLDRDVALKILPPERMADPKAVARFEREMKAVGRLNHPNIVQATDARSLQGCHFLVMEFVEGRNLSEVVQRCGVLSIADAAEVVRQAATGLQGAFEHSLVHRDIKPSNLMLSTQGTVKLLDLGLARFQWHETEQTEAEEMTAANQAMGTADYMAPEQVSDVRSVDIRADIYSLGCTLYKLLAGQPPFGGADFARTFDKMVAHVQKPPPDIRTFRPDLPGELLDVLDRMLAKKPEDRPATPAEVADLLATFCAGADLAKLLSEAEGQSRPAAPTDRSVAATDEYVSSALAGTRPSPRGASAGPAPAPQPLSQRAKWTVLAAVLAGLMGMGVLLGIVLRIRQKDGSETVLNVPSGAEVVVEATDRPIRIVQEGPRDGTGKVAKPAIDPQAKPGSESPPGEQPTPPVEQAPPETAKPPATTSASDPAGKPASDPTQKPAEKPAIGPDEMPGAKPVSGVGTKPETKPDQSHVPIVEVPPEKPKPEKPEPTTIAQRIARTEDAAAGARIGRRLSIVADPAPIEGVQVWSLETFGHRGPVYAVRYSPDGSLLATACGDGVVRVWDPAEGKVARMFAPYDGRVLSLAWSPDGSALATAGEDWIIRLWDARSGQTIRVLGGHLGEITALDWSADGQWLASASADKTVRLWDVTAEGPATVLRGHDAEVTSVAWSGGGLLASGGRGGAVCVWDVSAARTIHKLSGHAGPVLDVRFSPDGRLLASAGGAPRKADSIRVWDAASGSLVKAFAPHENGDGCLAWSPDGQLLVAGGYWFDDSVRVWDVGAGEIVHTLKKPCGTLPAFSADFGPDGVTVAVADAAGNVQFWEALAGRSLHGLPAHAASVRCAEFDPSSGAVAAGYLDGSVRIWAAETGEPVCTVTEAPAAAKQLAFSPDLRMLATRYETGGTIDIWDTLAGHRLAQIRGTRSEVEYLLWSIDSATVAAGNGTAQLYSATDGSQVRSLPTHGNTMAWSPDGGVLAVAVGGDVRLFSGGAGAPTDRFFLTRDDVVALAWSPDGELLAAACERNRLYLVKPQEPRSRPALLEGHKARVARLLWKDSNTLVSGSRDATRVWDAVAGKALAAMPWDGTTIAPDAGLFAQREGSLLRLRTLSDGRLVRTLVSLSGGGYLAVHPAGHYRVAPQSEAELACIVQTAEGQEMLSAAAFAERFGWKNDPALVRTWGD